MGFISAPDFLTQKQEDTECQGKGGGWGGTEPKK